MKKGFTLIELLVVVFIIGVLIGIGFLIKFDGIEGGKKQVQIEAVKMDVARWTVINEKGETEFRWNSPLAQSGCPMSKDGYLALLHLTNEFGVLDVRWMPPSRIESVAPKVSDVSTNCYILKLTDNTGKEFDVLIPCYSNATQLLLNSGNLCR